MRASITLDILRDRVYTSEIDAEKVRPPETPSGGLCIGQSLIAPSAGGTPRLQINLGSRAIVAATTRKNRVEECGLRLAPKHAI